MGIDTTEGYGDAQDRGDLPPRGFTWAELATARKAEIARLRTGLNAAIRAAELALFVVRKQGVMPNDSWEVGFKKDLATATAARGRG